MNAQTLHSIAVRIFDEIVNNQIRERLTLLSEGLANRVATPAEPAPQEQISTSLTELRQVLPTVGSNDFSPAWRQYLEEMGITGLLGQSLLDRIETIMAPAEMTTSVVRDEMQVLKDEMDRLYDAVHKTTLGLEALKIGLEDLQPGEVELGFLIPRSAVRNELGQLGDELERLKKVVIGPFQELATGTRADIPVRAIASSDFTILVQLDPATAAAIAKAIFGLTQAYKAFVEFRRIKAEARELGMPDEGLAGFDQHADQVISKTVADLTKEFLEGADGLTDEHRKNELEANLTISMRETARRIDVGYSISVRALPSPPEEVGEGEEPPPPPADQVHFEKIQELQPGLGFMRLEGEPLLGLTPGDGEDEEHAAEDGDGEAGA
jgi:hypothetical protein